jgi:glutamate dehydrogenase
VLRDTDPSESVAARIQAWEDDDEVVVTRAATTLGEICSDESADLARMSVGLRVVRGLLAG